MKRKVSVLFVIDKLNHGGAQDFLLNFLENNKYSQYEYNVCSLHKSENIVKDFYNLGIQIHSLDVSKGNPISIIKIVHLIKKNKIDIVHTFLFASNTYGRIAAILAKVPVIITHEVANDQPWKSPVHLLIDRLLSKFTDFIIANADAVRKYYVKHAKIHDQKVLKINTSVNSEPYERTYDIKSEKIRLGLDPQQPVVGFIGRLREQKRPQDFIKVAYEVVKSLPKVQFVIVGDGELRSTLDKLTVKLKLEKNIYFLGYRDDLPRIISVFNMLVLTSSYEGLPLVIMEAMLAKKPVVATWVDGNAEVVVHGGTGILVDVGEIPEFTRAVMKILQDPAMAGELGENGYKRMKEEFELQKIIKQIEEVYQKALTRIIRDFRPRNPPYKKGH